MIQTMVSSLYPRKLSESMSCKNQSHDKSNIWDNFISQGFITEVSGSLNTCVTLYHKVLWKRKRPLYIEMGTENYTA